jgi:hypothetical protein
VAGETPIVKTPSGETPTVIGFVHHEQMGVASRMRSARVVQV